MFPVSTGRGIDAPSRCARLPTWWAADTSGYRFEALPDGIALDANGNGHHVDVYVNHETSTVPFPYNPQNPTAANGENDFNNSQVSKLSLDFNDGVISVEEAEIVSGTEFGYQRFCSSYLATEKEGFNRPILFTNEEAVEWINTSGTPWPSAQGAAGARQSGTGVRGSRAASSMPRRCSARARSWLMYRHTRCGSRRPRGRQLRPERQPGEHHRPRRPARLHVQARRRPVAPDPDPRGLTPGS